MIRRPRPWTPVLALALVLLAPPRGHASREGPRYQIDIDVILDVPLEAPAAPAPEDQGRIQALGDLPGHLQEVAEALRAHPERTGYDWTFPYVYAKTTRRIVARIREGRYRDIELHRAVTGQFYEFYATNALGWTTGIGAEEPWQLYADKSREYHRDHGAESPFHAGLTFMIGAKAHILDDLPRVMLHTYAGRRATDRPVNLRVLERDYEQTMAVFPQVMREVLEERTFTPRWVDRALGFFPRWLRRTLEHGVGVAAVNEIIGLARRAAWTRFEYWANQGVDQQMRIATRFRTRRSLLPLEGHALADLQVLLPDTTSAEPGMAPFGQGLGPMP